MCYMQQTQYDVVGNALNEARLDLGERLKTGVVSWAAFARHVGVSNQTMVRFRDGERRTATTARLIERALGWPQGTIDAINAGAEAPPVGEVAEDDRGAFAERAELRRQIQLALKTAASAQEVAAEAAKRLQELDAEIEADDD